MRTLPRLAALLLACTLLAAPSSSFGGVTGDPDGTLRTPHERDRIPQTSDGVRGTIATPMPSYLRGLARTSQQVKWRVSPGVTYTRWTQTDARGPIRAHLLAIDLGTPGLALDYASPGLVGRTDQVSDIIARDRGVAGVNGDFFDIRDTGAPLGLGQDRQRGFLHAPRSGWNSAFYLTATGRPDIGYLAPQVAVAHRPRLRITNINSPEVRRGGIGIYTSRWGPTSGYRVTGGQTEKVRMVRVVGGRVVEIKRRLSAGQPIEGFQMIGRGAGAERLAGLRKGSRVTLTGRLRGGPRMAITGNKFLVRDGLIEVVNDREMHPRTAIGIDRDTHEVLLLVVDGRQAFSRGYTMVELADMMIDLGADEALNLDGGGSSTMLARRPRGGVGILNSPSDGVERAVANALAVTYRAPR